MIGVFKQEDTLGKRLVIVLKGLPCSWGKCVFCPFALEQGNLKQVIETNRRILKKTIYEKSNYYSFDIELGSNLVQI